MVPTMQTGAWRTDVREQSRDAQLLPLNARHERKPRSNHDDYDSALQPENTLVIIAARASAAAAAGGNYIRKEFFFGFFCPEIITKAERTSSS